MLRKCILPAALIAILTSLAASRAVAGLTRMTMDTSASAKPTLTLKLSTPSRVVCPRASIVSVNMAILPVANVRSNRDVR